MKAFMEEYGTVVVVAIVVLALIGVGLFFRSSGSESIRDTVKGFLNQAQLESAVADGSGNSGSSGGGSSDSGSGGGSGGSETPKAEIKTASFKTGRFHPVKGYTTTELQYEEGMTWNEWAQSEYAKGTQYEGCFFTPGVVMNPDTFMGTQGGMGTEAYPYIVS